MNVAYTYDLSRHSLSQSDKNSLSKKITAEILKHAVTDTGTFKRSWRVSWKSDTMKVYTNLYYAPYVELGTGYYTYHKYKVRDLIQKVFRRELDSSITLGKPPNIKAAGVADADTTQATTTPSVLPTPSEQITEYMNTRRSLYNIKTKKKLVPINNLTNWLLLAGLVAQKELDDEPTEEGT